MEMRINIPEEKMEEMSPGAKEKLEEKVIEYTDEVIREAKLIEEGEREKGAREEITSSIILQATQRSNRTIGKRKTPRYIILCRITSTISIWLTGFLYDDSGYQDNNDKLLLFVIMIVVACVTTVIQYLKEM